MTRIRTIATTNWMAFAGEQRLGPLPAGPIAVVARYANDPRRSNWACKTGLLEAVRFALTGRHRKRTDDAVITYGADRLEVLVELDTGARVVRSRPRGGPTLLRLTLPDGRELERDLAEVELTRLIGVESGDFENTSWVAQGDVEALVGQTSGIRREVVSRWLELERWERVGKLAAARALESRSTLERERLAAIESPSRSKEEVEADRANIEAQRAKITERAHELDAILSTANPRIEPVVDVQRAYDASLETIRSLRAELSALLARIVDPAVHAANETRLDVLRDELAIVGREQADARTILGSTFNGVCPIIRATCPAADHVRGQRTALEARYADASEKVRVLQAERDVLIDSVRRAEQDELARHRLVSRTNEAMTRHREIAKRLEEARAYAATYDEHALGEARAERFEISKSIEDLSHRLGVLWSEERQIEAHRVRIEERRNAVERLEKDARVTALAARALGPTGIPAKIAARSLAGLEARANELLAGSGLSFRLSWERELQEPSPTCLECGHVYERKKRERVCPACAAPRARKRSDELDILVDDGSGGELEDVRAKSGGAKTLIAIAIRLAGGMLLRERKGTSLDVAFVDEPFGALDEANRESLARTFAAMLGSVGLEQAFVVSHDAALLEGLPSRIVVIRDGAISRAILEG